MPIDPITSLYSGTNDFESRGSETKSIGERIVSNAETVIAILKSHSVACDNKHEVRQYGEYVGANQVRSTIYSLEEKSDYVGILELPETTGIRYTEAEKAYVLGIIERQIMDGDLGTVSTLWHEAMVVLADSAWNYSDVWRGAEGPIDRSGKLHKLYSSIRTPAKVREEAEKERDFDIKSGKVYEGFAEAFSAESIETTEAGLRSLDAYEQYQVRHSMVRRISKSLNSEKTAGRNYFSQPGINADPILIEYTVQFNDTQSLREALAKNLEEAGVRVSDLGHLRLNTAIRPGEVANLLQDASQGDRVLILASFSEIDPEELFRLVDNGDLTSEERVEYLTRASHYSPEKVIEHIDVELLSDPSYYTLGINLVRQLSPVRVIQLAKSHGAMQRFIEDEEVKRALKENVVDRVKEANTFLSAVVLTRHLQTEGLDFTDDPTISEAIASKIEGSILKEVSAGLLEVSDAEVFQDVTSKGYDAIVAEATAYLESRKSSNRPTKLEEQDPIDAVKTLAQIVSGQFSRPFGKRYTLEDNPVNIACYEVVLRSTPASELEDFINESYFLVQSETLSHKLLQAYRDVETAGIEKILFEAVSGLHFTSLSKDEQDWLTTKFDSYLHSLENDGLEAEPHILTSILKFVTLLDDENKKIDIARRVVKHNSGDISYFHNVELYASIYLRSAREEEEEFFNNIYRFVQVIPHEELLQMLDAEQDVRNVLNLLVLTGKSPEDRAALFDRVKGRFRTLSEFSSFDDLMHYQMLGILSEEEGSLSLIRSFKKLGLILSQEELATIRADFHSTFDVANAAIVSGIKALELDPTLSKSAIIDYIRLCINSDDRTDVVSDPSYLRVAGVYIDNPEGLVDLISSNREIDWNAGARDLFKSVVIPKSHDIRSFPRYILTSMFDLTDEEVESFLSLYSTKDLRDGVTAKLQMAGDLIYLANIPSGVILVREIADRISSAKKDSGRVRRILRASRVLNEAGVDIDSQVELREDADLAEMASLYNKAFIKYVTKLLKIREEDSDFVESRLDILSHKNMLDIYASLLSSYKDRGYSESIDLVSDFIRAVLLDRYEDWRNRSELSKQQLGILDTSDKLHSWISPTNLHIEIDKTQDVEAEKAPPLDKLSEARKIAEGFIADVKSLVPSDEESLASLRKGLEKIKQQRKYSSNVQKRQNLKSVEVAMEAKLELVVSALKLGSDIEDLTYREISDRLSSISSYIYKLPELAGAVRKISSACSHAVDSLHSLSKAVTTDISSDFSVEDTDDAWTLLNIGMLPVQTCQSWKGGIYNECLPAYIADPDKRAIVARDEHGRIIGRAILRLVNADISEHSGDASTDDRTGVKEPSILLEPTYVLADSKRVTNAIYRLARKKSLSMGVPLIVSARVALDELQDGLDGEGFEQVEFGSIPVGIRESRNKYQYSDTLGNRNVTRPGGSELVLHSATAFIPNTYKVLA